MDGFLGRVFGACAGRGNPRYFFHLIINWWRENLLNMDAGSRLLKADRDRETKAFDRMWEDQQ
jgi:hypothetical protein